MHEWLGSCCRRWRPRVLINNLHQKLMNLVQYSPITDPASTLRSQLRRGILMPTMRSLPAVLISTTPTAKFPSNTSMVCNISSTLTYDSSLQVTVFFFHDHIPVNFALWRCFKFRQNSKPLYPSKVRRFFACSVALDVSGNVMGLNRDGFCLFVQSLVYSHGRKLRRKSTRQMSSWTTSRRTVGTTTRRCWQLHRERSPTSKPTRRSSIPSICTNTKRFASFWTAWVCVATSVVHPRCKCIIELVCKRTNHRGPTPDEKDKSAYVRFFSSARRHILLSVAWFDVNISPILLFHLCRLWGCAWLRRTVDPHRN